MIGKVVITTVKHKFVLCKGKNSKKDIRCDPSVPHCANCGRQKQDCQNIYG